MRKIYSVIAAAFTTVALTTGTAYADTATEILNYGNLPALGDATGWGDWGHQGYDYSDVKGGGNVVGEGSIGIKRHVVYNVGAIVENNGKPKSVLTMEIIGTDRTNSNGSFDRTIPVANTNGLWTNVISKDLPFTAGHKYRMTIRSQVCVVIGSRTTTQWWDLGYFDVYRYVS